MTTPTQEETKHRVDILDALNTVAPFWNLNDYEIDKDIDDACDEEYAGECTFDPEFGYEDKAVEAAGQRAAELAKTRHSHTQLTALLGERVITAAAGVHIVTQSLWNHSALIDGKLNATLYRRLSIDKKKKAGDITVEDVLRASRVLVDEDCHGIPGFFVPRPAESDGWPLFELYTYF